MNNFSQFSGEKIHLSHADRNKNLITSEKQRIKLNISDNFLKKKHFLIL